MSMAGALIGIGKRNKPLNLASVKLANRISPVKYHDGDRKCDPIDILKHITSDYIKEKLGV